MHYHVRTYRYINVLLFIFLVGNKLQWCCKSCIIDVWTHFLCTFQFQRFCIVMWPEACFTKRSYIYELEYLIEYFCETMPANIQETLIFKLICSPQVRIVLVKQAPGGCFSNSDGLSDRGQTILLWTNNMGRWSVARSDGPSLLVKQPPGLD